MKENEIRNLIGNIKIELDTEEWVGIKHQSTRRYNKKCFFKCSSIFLVGVFFIYNNTLAPDTDFEFNSIISIDLDGNNITHKSLNDFYDYLLEMPMINNVTHGM